MSDQPVNPDGFWGALPTLTSVVDVVGSKLPPEPPSILALIRRLDGLKARVAELQTYSIELEAALMAQEPKEYKALKRQLEEAMELLSMCNTPFNSDLIDQWRRRVHKLESEVYP
jgi:hypothetical protein